MWGYPAGTARFFRSSASHVFALETATGRSAFLRFVPARVVDRVAVEATATLMDRLASHGIGTVPARRSEAGRLVETVGEGGDRMHAMVVSAAEGQQIDVDDLLVETAGAWGAALARWHRDGSVAAADLWLPDGADRIERAFAASAPDHELAAPIAVLRRWLANLPRDANAYGLVHGDFELDNVAWSGQRPMCFDLDEAERSWFAADIASAIRDLAPDPRALAAEPTPLLAAFLDSYRQHRPDAAIDRRDLIGFTAVNAVRSIAQLAPVLAEDPSTGADLMSRRPEGLVPLRTVLERYADADRRIAIDLAPMLG